jgi:competence protein ComEC
VIGVGVDNDYGHPSVKALDLLTRNGVGTVLRTDLQGDGSLGLIDGVLTASTRGSSAGAAG